MENFGTPMDPGSSRARARQDVSLPAILLMAFSALTFLFFLVSLVQTLAAKPTDPAELAELRQMMEDQGLGQYFPILERSTNIPKGKAVAAHLPFLIINALVFLGALMMKGLKGYGLALTSGILALAPCCGPCCGVLGIPLGIWALVVLRKPEVRSAFI